jgi:hypothetical protein
LVRVGRAARVADERAATTNHEKTSAAPACTPVSCRTPSSQSELWKSALIDHAIALLEDANADLQPELLPAPVAHRLLRAYARAEKLAGFGVAALARRIDEASALGRVTGTFVGKAKETIATSRAPRGALGATSTT